MALFLWVKVREKLQRVKDHQIKKQEQNKMNRLKQSTKLSVFFVRQKNPLEKTLTELFREEPKSGISDCLKGAVLNVYDD